ncbi:hypothetical protein Nepgr_032444 [Nepenthes gracilis]|uniref:Uncharacterized protein n=1 Tax=Nepenthes gracilis TaxID=150966 RepID=A0AAD3Y8A8_NEPGR|nr:hypothetical protein Nepgr_032444 [Nepenthes gracilis]
MAAIPLCYKMSYKSQSLSAAKIPKGFSYERHIIHEGFRCLSSISPNISGRWKVVLADTIIASRKGSKSNADPENSFQKEQLYPIYYYSLESKSSVKHQILSDSYLEKLKNETKHPTSNSTNDTTQHGDRGSLLKARKALGSLDAYLAALT